MSWKIVGTATAAVLALAACDTNRSDRSTSAAAARSVQMPSASASPAVGSTPALGGPINQSATTVAPSTTPMPMATAPTGTMSDRRMSAAERRRMERDERRASGRRGGSMSDRDRAYMGGGMVGGSGGSTGMSGSMGAPAASSLGNPSSVGGVGGSNTASSGPGGTSATGSGNQPGTGGSSRGGQGP